MARPRKDKLDYFSLDTDFFSDKKVKILKARYGTDGVTMYIYLLCEIYKNGYYLKIDEDYDYIMSQELSMSVDKVMQIRTFLLERSMFDKQLFQSDAVLTSTGIQKRYQEAVRGRASKTPIEVDKFWLLKKNETQSFIKVKSFLNNSENNNSFYENNSSFSEEKCTKESKINKKKINKTKVKCVEEHTQPEPAHTPLKEDDYKSLCEKYGQSLVDIYIERTSNYKCCNAYTVEKWINEDLENERSRKEYFKEMKAKKNQFNNFPQRDYSKDDMDELEKKLLERSYSKLE